MPERGRRGHFNVTLGTLPEQREANATPGRPRERGTTLPQLGLTVAPRAGGDGVIVSNVDPEGAAAGRGFRNGDVIFDVSGKTVATAGDLQSAIDAAQESGKQSVLMQVRSGTTMKFVAVPLSRGWIATSELSAAWCLNEGRASPARP